MFNSFSNFKKYIIVWDFIRGLREKGIEHIETIFHILILSKWFKSMHPFAYTSQLWQAIMNALLIFW